MLFFFNYSFETAVPKHHTIYNGEIVGTQNHCSYACWQIGMNDGGSMMIIRASVSFSLFCSWESYVCAYICVYIHMHPHIVDSVIFFNCNTLHYSPIT